jgi:anthranilate phosphoribosyltransferase
MLGEARLNNFSPQASDARIRAFLIALHERRETGDVSR